MAAAKTTAQECIRAIAGNLKLRPSKAGGCFGAISGVPVHFVPLPKGNLVTVGLFVWLPDGADPEAFRAGLAGDAAIAGAGFDAKNASVTGRHLLYVFPNTFMGRVELSGVTGVVGPLVAAWRARFPEGTAPADGKLLALVDNLPVLATPEELRALKERGTEMNEAYLKIEPRRAAAIGAMTGAAIAGAVVWALIGTFLRLQAWIVAIGIGYGISWLARRVGGRVDGLTRAAAFVLTLACTILGEILSVAFYLQREGHGFDPLLAAGLYLEALGAGTGGIWGSLLFALGGGALGAWYALKNAAPPVLIPQIETLDEAPPPVQ